MPCLNYIVASLQCLKYAMYICGISFPVWLAVFGVCIPRVTHTHTHTYTRSANSVTIMCLALRRSAITIVKKVKSIDQPFKIIIQKPWYSIKLYRWFHSYIRMYKNIVPN